MAGIAPGLNVEGYAEAVKLVDKSSKRVSETIRLACELIEVTIAAQDRATKLYPAGDGYHMGILPKKELETTVLSREAIIIEHERMDKQMLLLMLAMKDESSACLKAAARNN